MDSTNSMNLYNVYLEVILKSVKFEREYNFDKKYCLLTYLILG